jgi:hypothetical protein
VSKPTWGNLSYIATITTTITAIIISIGTIDEEWNRSVSPARLHNPLHALQLAQIATASMQYPPVNNDARKQEDKLNPVHLIETTKVKEAFHSKVEALIAGQD